MYKKAKAIFTEIPDSFSKSLAKESPGLLWRLGVCAFLAVLIYNPFQGSEFFGFPLISYMIENRHIWIYRGLFITFFSGIFVIGYLAYSFYTKTIKDKPPTSTSRTLVIFATVLLGGVLLFLGLFVYLSISVFANILGASFIISMFTFVLCATSLLFYGKYEPVMTKIELITGQTLTIEASDNFTDFKPTPIKLSGEEGEEGEEGNASKITKIRITLDGFESSDINELKYLLCLLKPEIGKYSHYNFFRSGKQIIDTEFVVKYEKDGKEMNKTLTELTELADTADTGADAIIMLNKILGTTLRLAFCEVTFTPLKDEGEVEGDGDIEVDEEGDIEVKVLYSGDEVDEDDILPLPLYDLRESTTDFYGLDTFNQVYMKGLERLNIYVILNELSLRLRGQLYKTFREQLDNIKGNEIVMAIASGDIIYLFSILLTYRDTALELIQKAENTDELASKALDSVMETLTDGDNANDEGGEGEKLKNE